MILSIMFVSSVFSLPHWGSYLDHGEVTHSGQKTQYKPLSLSEKCRIAAHYRQTAKFTQFADKSAETKILKFLLKMCPEVVMSTKQHVRRQKFMKHYVH